MKIMRSSFLFNISFLLIGSASLCLWGCNGNVNQDSNNVGKNKVAAQKGVTNLFLSYTDSLIKLPLASFNEEGILSLNKRFEGNLPLIIYNGKKGDDGKSIVIQPYQNKGTATNITAGIILLLPKHIADSLHIGDFTRYFGNIKEEQPAIGVTEQPLPVEINVNGNTSLKLTFNNNKKLHLAQVTTVEVLKYR